MFKHIIVGCDGTPGGRDAATLGSALARITGARLTLLGVYPPALLPIPGMTDRQTERRRLFAMLREVQDEHAPHAVVHVQANPSPAWELRHYTERVGGDLLVVGARRTDEPGHVGVDTRKLHFLPHAPFAVAIAERGLHERSLVLRSIGVGWDGSVEADAAAIVAADLARAAHGKLHVLRVVEDRVPSKAPRQWLSAPVAEEHWEPERQAAVAAAERAMAQLGADAGAGVDVDVQAVVGDPAGCLRDLSEAVDLVVFGSRRWGTVARVVVGAAGEALVHDARASLLIVPRPGSPHEHGRHRHAPAIPEPA